MHAYRLLGKVHIALVQSPHLYRIRATEIFILLFCSQGRVKVVRNQTIIDVQNENKFAGQTREDLGCVRPFSHAGGKLKHMTMYTSNYVYERQTERPRTRINITTTQNRKIHNQSVSNITYNRGLHLHPHI